MPLIEHLTPATEEGWWLLFELAEADPDSWALIGGQMVQVVVAAHDAGALMRPTDDIDVLVDVRVRRRGTEWLARWLLERGFELAGIGPDGIGNQFVRDAQGGAGRIHFDVLAPEGLGQRTTMFTSRPARTVGVPGSTQAVKRSELVEVTVSGLSGRPARTGRVRCPNLLGAVVAKAAATTIAVRKNRNRDWQDAALLLSLAPDPLVTAAECTKKDRQRLRCLTALENPDHPGWALLTTEHYRRGVATLSLLLG